MSLFDRIVTRCKRCHRPLTWATMANGYDTCPECGKRR